MPLVLTEHPIDWHAQFAWSPNSRERGLAVRHFRLTFDLPAVPPSLLIHVTADSRYRLLLNGTLLGRGPAKGTLAHYTVETYDLIPGLQSGRNVLAAEVRWFGENAPMSEVHSDEPGFLVHAPNRPELDTPGRWRVRHDLSVTPDTTSYHDNAQQFLNHMDRVDFRHADPADWTRPTYDDSAWAEAVAIGIPTLTHRKWGVADLRALQPRDIPALEEEDRLFLTSRTLDRAPCEVHAGKPVPWRIPAGKGGTLLLDAGEMTTGFPVLRFHGGGDREVRITYAEAMGTWVEKQGRSVWEKSRRDDPHGQPHGYRDTLFLSGRGDRFEPFHWRTFWFISIKVLPGAADCELTGAGYRRCVYPLRLQAEYDSSDPDTRRFMATSWRTLQLCAHETFEDCPYYEQQNYIADTRLQALAACYLANETRLVRRCLLLFRDSARPDGLIGSRVPSRQPQVIPYFCLHWVFMVEDYWRWVGNADDAFVRSCLPVIDGILGYFRTRLRADGFVGKVDPWNMVDPNDGWIRGEPPAVIDGGSTYLTCLYIQALECAIRLHEQAGQPEDAGRWRHWPDELRRAVQTGAWDEDRGLYLEGPGRLRDRCSQHAQSAAVLAGVPSRAQTSRLLGSLVSDPGLLPARFMQSFYVARALESAGGYSHFHTTLLEPWRVMLRQGSSTWWEYSDPTRSDCHAWSSWIATDFLSTVLGIRPARPGWTAILLAPHTDGLDRASGSVTTPAGKIVVQWRKQDDGLVFDAHTPPGIPVTLILPGEEATAHPAGGRIVRHAPSISAEFSSPSPPI